METGSQIAEREEDRRIELLSKELTDAERRFVEIWKLGRVHPRVAMKEAGYAQSTIDKHGPSWIIKRPRVQAYVKALSDTKLDSIVGAVQAQFLRLEYSLEIALNTITQLAESAEDEGVKLRAAKALIDLGKGILLATIPQKRMDFSVLMRDIYQEAREAREKANKAEKRPYVEVDPSTGTPFGDDSSHTDDAEHVDYVVASDNGDKGSS